MHNSIRKFSQIFVDFVLILLQVTKSLLNTHFSFVKNLSLYLNAISLFYVHSPSCVLNSTFNWHTWNPINKKKKKIHIISFHNSPVIAQSSFKHSSLDLCIAVLFCTSGPDSKYSNRTAPSNTYTTTKITNPICVQAARAQLTVTRRNNPGLSRPSNDTTDDILNLNTNIFYSLHFILFLVFMILLF